MNHTTKRILFTFLCVLAISISSIHIPNAIIEDIPEPTVETAVPETVSSADGIHSPS